MAKLEYTSVLNTLNKRIREVQNEGVVSYLVGFTANYAIWVHERLGVVHPVGEAKYLENAILENQRTIPLIVTNALLAGKKLSQSVLLAALFVQREAQLRCPVDTGYLRASAFTKKESIGEAN